MLLMFIEVHLKVMLGYFLCLVLFLFPWFLLEATNYLWLLDEWVLCCRVAENGFIIILRRSMVT